MRVHLPSGTVSIQPRQLLGQGGEAEIYDLGSDLALKLFKPPTHPDFLDPAQQTAAAARLHEHQTKLPAFPSGLPARVVAPLSIARKDNSTGPVCGYTMSLVPSAEPLLRYGEKSFRQSSGVSQSTVAALFLDLHATVAALHSRQIVIGDFNDLNILVTQSTQANLIDADSLQFGAFPCRVFTERFADPLLCDPAAPALSLIRPHDTRSDWYAFAIMLFQSLLLVHPYGGVHSPGPGRPKIPPRRRPLERIPVFHPEVIAPRVSLPLSILPDPLRDLFQQTFSPRDLRGPLPSALLDPAAWRPCPVCALDHARSACPACHPHVAPVTLAAPPPPSAVTGPLRVTEIFRAPQGSRLLAAENFTGDAGGLRWLLWTPDHPADPASSGRFLRENGALAFTGRPDPALRYLLPDRHLTLAARGPRIFLLRENTPPQSFNTDLSGSEPTWATDGHTLLWAENGLLRRLGPHGPETLGDTLPGHTRLAAAPGLALGYYRAGPALTRAFVLHPEHPGLNDRVPLPPLAGHILDWQCRIGAGYAWAVWTLQRQGQIYRHALVILSDGTVAAQLADIPDSAPETEFLATLHRGHSLGPALLAPTDRGIVQLAIANRSIVLRKTFPDTAPYVNSHTRLLPAPGGLHAVTEHAIHLLAL